MKKEKQRLEAKIKSLQKQLAIFPKGKLYIVPNRQYSKWYQTDGHTSTYIPKKNRNLAERLAVKKYLSAKLDACTHEMNAIEFYLRHHDSHTEEEAQQLLHSPAYQELLSKFFAPSNQEFSDWMQSPYEHNPLYPEQLLHKGSSGILLRSKSEAIIEMFLYVNQIPFRYECALPLGESMFYPDFTILHPHTGQVFYWEHFGMMDDSNYSQKAFQKLQCYAVHGIIPTVNLITTYETREHPLSPSTVEKVIRDFLLTDAIT